MDDVVNVTEVKKKESSRQDSRDTTGVKERGMYVEKHQELGRTHRLFKSEVLVTNRKEGIRKAYEKSDISIVLRDGRAGYKGKGDTVTCAEQRKQSPDK